MTGEAVTADAELDARDLFCPLPVLKARKALQPLRQGQVLAVRATDPAARQDFPAFCAATGHCLVGVAEEPDGVVVYTIRKAG
jgi:tRNA 2-thiouridine synthesizing protein A